MTENGFRFGVYFIPVQSSEPPEELVRECAAIALKHAQRAMDADLLFGRELLMLGRPA